MRELSNFQLCVQSKAKQVFTSLDRNERVGIKFGMFPAIKMQDAEKELADQLPRYAPKDISRELAVALMDQTEMTL